MNSYIFLFITLLTGIKCCGDFYWRDYEGVIPEDAFPAGNSSATNLTYIGQAYIHEVGLIVGTIIPGEDGMILASAGIRTADAMIKILCVQDASKYHWVETTSSTYKRDMTYKCPVLGGYNQTEIDSTVPENGGVSVGRVIESDSSNTTSSYYTYIGSIAAYYIYPEAYMFYYNYRLQEEEVTSYFSVLVYSAYALK